MLVLVVSPDGERIVRMVQEPTWSRQQGPDHGSVQEGEAGGMRRRCKISRRRCKRCKRRRRCKRREEAREAGARLVQRSCVLDRVVVRSRAQIVKPDAVFVVFLGIKWAHDIVEKNRS